MAGRGPRHYPKESPQSRDGHYMKEGARRAISPDPTPLPGPAHPPGMRLDLEGPPNLMGPHGLQNPPLAVEQKLAAQHAEIQRLIGENQRLAVTHVALRQELAAAQQEIMRLQQSRPVNDTEKEQRLNITQVALRQELADSKQEVNKLQEVLVAIRAEKDQHLRAAMDKSARMEAELKATEAMKVDFEKLRFEREELAARVDHLAGEVKKIPVKDQEISSLKREVDELLQRHQQARMDYELQKKLNLEHLEQQQAMEKNAFAMTREIERLRAELANVDRRQHAYLSASSGGTAAAPSFQKSVQPVGVYENSYGTSQDALKGSSSENKSPLEASKYSAGIEPSDSRLPKPTSVNADLAGEWSKHAAPNGRSFYYNLATGATQWDKPSAAPGVDASAVHQRQMQQTQGAATQDLNPELAALQHQQQKPALQQQQPAQQAVSPATVPAAQQTQPGNNGVNLLVLGLSEGISDRDLASLFHPYGAILHAKVVVDTKTGTPQFYGLVTMENAQAAEAAAAAVTGMFILGRRIKVEIQLREQAPLHQGHAPHLMQQGMMQGGVGPMRAHHRAGGPPGHWPY
eukprot:c19033_g1_i1 orf=159-1883(+)